MWGVGAKRVPEGWPPCTTLHRSQFGLNWAAFTLPATRGSGEEQEGHEERGLRALRGSLRGRGHGRGTAGHGEASPAS